LAGIPSNPIELEELAYSKTRCNYCTKDDTRCISYISSRSKNGSHDSSINNSHAGTIDKVPKDSMFEGFEVEEIHIVKSTDITEYIEDDHSTVVK